MDRFAPDAPLLLSWPRARWPRKGVGCEADAGFDAAWVEEVRCPVLLFVWRAASGLRAAAGEG